MGGRVEARSEARSRTCEYRPRASGAGRRKPRLGRCPSAKALARGAQSRMEGSRRACSQQVRGDASDRGAACPARVALPGSAFVRLRSEGPEPSSRRVSASRVAVSSGDRRPRSHRAPFDLRKPDGYPHCDASGCGRALRRAGYDAPQVRGEDNRRNRSRACPRMHCRTQAGGE